ncbi:aminotransferase class III-fold pyridoxal phosphate-dependent enzyme [Streptomyces bambusae]|uniref:Diaminobutyrate--2-oxoglutarate transaminase n=1 Tax=Streptomyces bambusae TaxID=1550616 RepID=A0ABS6Z9K8_9ACTN|nr:aminotransferase class III-fold pyridoxal phosphate-dependent enzyme [Streptomyces bambusae]MBW5484453.1 aminotransferase class III-fold pyridoxal phosphate-dependent enzyme [Streptomyces bambusae]
MRNSRPRGRALRESASPRTYLRSLPVVPVRTRGLTIEGADGRRYLDRLSGGGALAFGHYHPVVLEAVRRVIDSGAPPNVLDLASPVRDAFTAELFADLPSELTADTRVVFCGPAGTDAVEAALRLVRTATGRPGLLAFTGARHGTTTVGCTGAAGDLPVAPGPAGHSGLAAGPVAGRALGPARHAGPVHDASPAPGPGPARRTGYAPAPHLAAAVVRACLERGLTVGTGGRRSHVVRLLPPLILTDEQATAVLDRLADALEPVIRPL